MGLKCECLPRSNTFFPCNTLTLPSISIPPSPFTDQIQQKLEGNNVFLIARRQVDVGGVNQELMYMSLKFINGIWVLVEVKVAPGSTSMGVSVL